MTSATPKTRSRLRALLPYIAVLELFHLGCAARSPAVAAAPGGGSCIAVYGLSRGKGVPPPTREALGRARALLEDLQRQGRARALSETRIGIEGETRIRVEVRDAAAARDALERLRAIAREVELLNVVEEPCSKRP